MDGGAIECSEPDRRPDFDLDFDYLLASFSDDFADPLLSESGSPNSLVSDPISEPQVSDGPTDAGSPGSISSYVTELEKFLMEDADAEEDGGKGLDDVFFAGFFADASDDGVSEAATPEAESADKEKKEEAPVVDDSEDDGPISKKQRRQMRNRDSAMKSRERKKMYIKELEMKSKYLESECRRLNYALQCCAAENMALHQSLQKERLSDDLLAKQESAALFVESRLLGSLFWLVSIICLFLIPRLPSQSPRTARSPERGLIQLVVAAGKANEKLITNFWLELALIGRRFRGMKMRMKSILFPVVCVF
ncbi:bZIP transcription factor 50 [Typha latifolia]|uniref:bZIP transcription factor 50 n=1 Tax=Typha latifolia TaxID=4733 RepID=UPI003C2C3834